MFKNRLEKWKPVRTKETPVKRPPILSDTPKTQLRKSVKTRVVPGCIGRLREGLPPPCEAGGRGCGENAWEAFTTGHSGVSGEF